MPVSDADLPAAPSLPSGLPVFWRPVSLIGTYLPDHARNPIPTCPAEMAGSTPTLGTRLPAGNLALSPIRSRDGWFDPNPRYASLGAPPTVGEQQAEARYGAAARLHDMTHDFDDDANTPNGAERPGDVPPGPPAPQPDGSPSDDAEVRATPQQLNISMELLVAMSAAAQQQLKASMEPLVAMSAAAQQQLKASMEPLVAISAAAQQQLKASMEPLVAISTAAQQQIEALAAQIDLPAVHQLSAWTKRYDEVFEQIAKAAVFEFPEIDLRIEDLDRWIPSNLHNLQGLGAVFSVALDEGIPFSWIPRPVTVAALVEAEGAPGAPSRPR